MQVDPLVLYYFSNWANGRIMSGARELSDEQLHAPIRSGFLSTLGLMVHIMAAERAWLSRWKGSSPDALIAPDSISTLDAVEDTWQPLRVEMIEYLAQVGDAQQVITYRTTKGQEYDAMLWQLIMHVINHGTEHRSQAALHLAMQGIDLGSLDFSHYIRDIAP